MNEFTTTLQRIRILSIIIIGAIFFISCSGNKELIIKPDKYENALRNPLMGFTTRGIYDHPWATTAQVYIRWNEIENDKSDGIDKIKDYCDQEWEGIEEKNIKVIPRVYLHWNNNDKFWPADMQTDDYDSDQFKKRVVRLIERLGILWDNDPRVAFVELGIFGKWGEQHSPFPTAEMEKVVGDAFAKAFKNKKVSVRRNWERFTHHPFGEYWDSWAHYNQMWPHGNSIKKLNEDKGRYLENYIGGEVAYDWGDSDIQPGPNPTASVAKEKHRSFIINSIRWLHCTQLRWIDDYDLDNPEAQKGAEQIQKAFGYRYELNEVRLLYTEDSLKISFDITNTGSAPFYYNWPVEVALLDESTLKPVWKSTLDKVDIRKWLPGEGWTDPEWEQKSEGSDTFVPNPDWISLGTPGWKILPKKNTVEETLSLAGVKKGSYIISLAVLDPAGNIPSLRFAAANYIDGGRHPLGVINIEKGICQPLPNSFKFDDLALDTSLYYVNN